MKPGFIIATSLVSLGALGAAAVADPAGASEDRLTVPKGHGVVSVLVAASLSKDAAFEPVSVAPDLWYGVTDDLTVGLLHSGRASTGFLGGAENSLCLTGKDGGCESVYPGAGVAARVRLGTQAVATAVEAGVFASDLDPLVLSAKLGVAVRWRTGKLAVEATPSIFIGLTERDGTADSVGNKETILIPVSLSYAVAPQLALALQSGFILPTEETSHLYLVPLSIGVQYAASPALFVEAAFSLPALGGGDVVPTGTDVRTLSLGAGYAF